MLIANQESSFVFREKLPHLKIVNQQEYIGLCLSLLEAELPLEPIEMANHEKHLNLALYWNEAGTKNEVLILRLHINGISDSQVVLRPLPNLGFNHKVTNQALRRRLQKNWFLKDIFPWLKTRNFKQVIADQVLPPHIPYFLEIGFNPPAFISNFENYLTLDL